ncbi:hypothetical protein JCM1840_001474 [Sporobolomyces johnsonii]
MSSGRCISNVRLTSSSASPPAFTPCGYPVFEFPRPAPRPPKYHSSPPSSPPLPRSPTLKHSLSSFAMRPLSIASSSSTSSPDSLDRNTSQSLSDGDTTSSGWYKDDFGNRIKRKVSRPWKRRGRPSTPRSTPSPPRVYPRSSFSSDSSGMTGYKMSVRQSISSFVAPPPGAPSLVGLGSARPSPLWRSTSDHLDLSRSRLPRSPSMSSLSSYSFDAVSLYSDERPRAIARGTSDASRTWYEGDESAVFPRKGSSGRLGRSYY